MESFCRYCTDKGAQISPQHGTYFISIRSTPTAGFLNGVRRVLLYTYGLDRLDSESNPRIGGMTPLNAMWQFSIG